MQRVTRDFTSSSSTQGNTQTNTFIDKKAQFFFTRAIRPERTFLRRLHKATLGVSEFHCHIRITQSIRQEVMFVCNFISM